MKRRILILEDEVLLAMDLADELESAGFEVIGPATSVSAALRLLETTPVDAAVLDINLGSENSEPVAIALSGAGTPFVVLSGNSRPHQPAVFHAAPFLPKPFLASDVVNLLSARLATAGAHGSPAG
jgi:DNA-binding response OmpR family regulator